MAIFCKNCARELEYTLHMKRHTILCLGDRKNEGEYAGKWDAAMTSPMLMFNTYYTTIYPIEVIIAKEIEEMIEVDNLKERTTIMAALDHIGVRNRVKARLSDILEKPAQLREFKWREFESRLAISGNVQNDRVFYRKMSDLEWAAVSKANDPFKPTFTYTNTDNYRYWLSSSLAKVNAFGNANSTDAGGVIVKLEFKSSPLTKFKYKAHQEPGVQNDPEILAIHREGFAEVGDFSCKKDVDEVIENDLDFNIGFTSRQQSALKSLLLRYGRL